MKYRSPETVCGVASSIGRDGEEMKVISLKELADYPADMFTTVFIGKTSTVKIGKWMVTPRGYLQKRRNNMAKKCDPLCGNNRRADTG